MRLIEEWRHCWRWSSVRLAMLTGALVSWAATDPTGYTHAVEMLPEWARQLVGILMAAAAISPRVTTKGARSDG